MKKILVTATTFPRYLNDTEPRFVYDLCQEYKKYYQVTVLVPASCDALDYEIMDGIEVIRYRYFPIRRLETLCYPGSIVERIKEKKMRIFLVPFLILSMVSNLCRRSSHYDIVHAHWLVPQGLIQSMFKTKFLITGHGTDISSLNNPIMKFFKRKALMKASHVTVVSESLKKIVLNYAPIENKLSVAPMGIAVNEFGKSYHKDNYFGQGEKKIVLFVGRLAEIKGVSYLIKAVDKLNVRLVIVGDGPLKFDLEQQAKELKSDVLFLGSKTHEELKIIYASSDVFVAPSITVNGAQEGLGLVILEAMSSGLPIIGSNSGGIPTLIEESINGYLVEEKNVEQLHKMIYKVINLSEEEYHLLSSNARKKAEEYDYNAIGIKYKEIIDSIIEHD